MIAGDADLGLASGTVRVVPWNARWPELYAEEEARILAALEGTGVTLTLERPWRNVQLGHRADGCGQSVELELRCRLVVIGARGACLSRRWTNSLDRRRRQHAGIHLERRVVQGAQL